MMRSPTLRGLCLVCAAASFAQADFKANITYSNSSSGPGFQITTMEKGARRRTESAPSSVMLNREDSTILLDTQAKTYQRIPVGGGSANPETETASPAPLAATSGALVKVSSTIEDTGERKQAFGRTARRLKTVTVTDAPANACSPGMVKMETDGWYIDWPSQASERTQNQNSSTSAAPNCRDTFVFEQRGSGKPGYPIEYFMKMWAGNDAPVTMSMKVNELSFDELDAALFEVPTDYREYSAAQPGAPATAAPRGVKVAVAPVTNQPPGASSYLSSMLNSSGIPATAISSPTVEAASAAGAEFLLTVDMETAGAKKKGGMFGKLAKSIGGEESKANYTLTQVSTGAQRARSSVAMRSGGMGAGAGMMLAAGVAGGAASAAGSHTGAVAANTITHTMTNQMAQSAYANPQAGRMDPALQQVAYMSAYSPRYAAAQGAGTLAAHAMTSPSQTPGGNQPPPEGAMANLLDKVAEAVVQTLAN